MSQEIFDSHQHFWQVGRFDYPWMSPELDVLCQDYLPAAVAPILQRCGVEKTILVQASNSLEETRWLLSLAEQYPFIAGVVGWVDLTSPTVDEQLEELAAQAKFIGVRHLVESEPADDWLTHPAVLNGFRRLQLRGIAYDLLVHPRHLKYAQAVAERSPELRLVVDHLAKPPIARGEITDWARELKALASFSNVWCKLSGLVTEADHKRWRPEDLKPFVDTAVECFGPERMMFGSDWPVCLLAGSYDQVLETYQMLVDELTQADRDGIFSGNAASFYRVQMTTAK